MASNAEDADADAGVLTRGQVSARLGVLGLDPFSQVHVFTTATLTSLELTDVSVLREFPHLQHLVCSGNCLTSLSVLQHLPVLLSLDASDNQLTQLLDFEVPQCTRETAWADGARWLGSLLRRADLSRNSIAAMPSRDLAQTHPFLVELRLAHNAISAIAGVSRLRFLRVLDLSHNWLMSTAGLVDGEESGLPALETLLLSHNQLTAVEGVAALPRLHHLDLSSNHIAKLDDLPGCSTLQRLELADNSVESVNELNHLMQLPLLAELSLERCPVVAGAFYRARALRRLQQLRSLDGELVTAKEKVKSLVMHGDDVASRRAVAAAVLPTLEFVNYLPPLEFEDDEQLHQLEVTLK